MKCDSVTNFTSRDLPSFLFSFRNTIQFYRWFLVCFISSPKYLFFCTHVPFHQEIVCASIRVSACLDQGWRTEDHGNIWIGERDQCYLMKRIQMRVVPVGNLLMWKHRLIVESSEPTEISNSFSWQRISTLPCRTDRGLVHLEVITPFRGNPCTVFCDR